MEMFINLADYTWSAERRQRRMHLATEDCVSVQLQLKFDLSAHSNPNKNALNM